MFCEICSGITEEQEQRGFIAKFESPGISNNPCHYLAHKGVKKERVTTPVRIAYDCSAKTDEKELSLNDCLHTGLTLLVADLAAILLRFRLHKYAWISDIKKAYLMVKLHEGD